MVMVIIPSLAHAQLTLAPDCKAELPPSDPQSCNIQAFLKWIKKLINFLLIIAIPLGAIFVVWGGFVIMTAGGSEDKFKRGKQIITAAVIGIAISFGAWLIINALNFFLVSEFQFK